MHVLFSLAYHLGVKGLNLPSSYFVVPVQTMAYHAFSFSFKKSDEVPNNAFSITLTGSLMVVVSLMLWEMARIPKITYHDLLVFFYHSQPESMQLPCLVFLRCYLPPCPERMNALFQLHAIPLKIRPPEWLTVFQMWWLQRFMKLEYWLFHSFIVPLAAS